MNRSNPWAIFFWRQAKLWILALIFVLHIRQGCKFGTILRAKWKVLLHKNFHFAPKLIQTGNPDIRTVQHKNECIVHIFDQKVSTKDRTGTNLKTFESF